MAEYYPKTGVCYDHAEGSKIYLIYNFSCNAACDHCLVESNPKQRKKLDPATAVELLSEGARYRKNFLTLSGGEAMLFPREVMTVTGAARDLGYYICLNTNAFWARTPTQARDVLADLKAAGVQAIFPTASAYHAKYVPLERVKHLRDACRDLGVVCEINFFDSTDSETDARIKRELGFDEEVYFFDGLTPYGNNPDTVEQLKQLYTRRTPADIDDCLSVHLGANPHGHVVTTCNMTYDNEKYRGTPFFLGNFREQPFGEILRAEQESRVLQFIYHNPHPAMHNLLAADEEIGDYHRRTFTDRRYFTVIDYYVDLFRDDLVMDWLSRHLPDPRTAALDPV